MVLGVAGKEKTQKSKNEKMNENEKDFSESFSKIVQIRQKSIC